MMIMGGRAVLSDKVVGNWPYSVLVIESSFQIMTVTSAAAKDEQQRCGRKMV